MQSPARIEAVLQQLRAAWERYPEMRLGQLICSAAAIASPTNGSDSSGAGRSRASAFVAATDSEND